MFVFVSVNAGWRRVEGGGCSRLSERRLHVYPGAHVLVAQEAGVGGQGVVGKNGVVVGGAGAGRVLARRGVLLEGRRQVQVLRGERGERGLQRHEGVSRNIQMFFRRLSDCV